MIMSTIVFLASIASVAGAETPMTTLKTKNGEVDKLLRVKTDPGTPAEKKVKDDIKVIAGTLLDYGELTKKAMDEHWNKIKQTEQNDLVDTLKQLIERNYVKQLRSNLDYKINYTDEKVAGDQAEVMSIVKVKTKGKSTDAEIKYKLRKVGDKWMVWDVITDEVSLMRNYKSQFNRIITESGFPELLKKMKNKLKDPEGTVEDKKEAKR
jgi:phospholipid transport system substrate-binding protein